MNEYEINGFMDELEKIANPIAIYLGANLASSIPGYAIGRMKSMNERERIRELDRISDKIKKGKKRGDFGKQSPLKLTGKSLLRLPLLAVPGVPAVGGYRLGRGLKALSLTRAGDPETKGLKDAMKGVPTREGTVKRKGEWLDKN